MAAEDVSFFLNAVPGCFFFVGSGVPGEQPVSHHTPEFDIVEESMMIGASIFVQLITDLMIEKTGE